VGGATGLRPIRSEPPRNEPIRMEASMSEPITSADSRIGSGKTIRSVRISSAEKTRTNSYDLVRQNSPSGELRPVRPRTPDSASRSVQNRLSGTVKESRHGDNDISDRNSVRDTRSTTLEAVVTLTKGRTGDATDVHMIPSPPTSAKPSSSRPGSAQRFRSMVIDCRDSK